MKDQFKTLPGFSLEHAVKLSMGEFETLNFGDDTLPPRVQSADSTEHKERFVQGTLLGKGGMGSVYVGFDRVLQREVAIKSLIDKALPHTNPWRRFMRESQITAQLSHPSIVPIHSIEVNPSGQPTLIMKRIHGQTMEDYLQKCIEVTHKSEKVPDAYQLTARIDMMINICEAISYAHSRGVVHRDLKPPNIMVGEFDEVYVMDWGIAKLIDDEMPFEEGISLSGTGVHTKVGALMGSPMYMAPEQARGENELIGPASDQYSIGVMLYEMVCLETVRKGQSLKTLILEAGDGLLPDFTQLSIKVPPELQAIILTCLQPDIHQRYPSVAKLTRDLRRFNHRKSVSVYTESTAEQIKRFIQNNTALTVGSTMGLAVLASIFAAVYLQQLLLLQEQATIEKENTSHLIQIISGHARSIDQVFAETQLLVHGLSEVTQLKYNQASFEDVPCSNPEDLPLRPHVLEIDQYLPNLASLHEPVCITPKSTEPEEARVSRNFSAVITPDLINAYRNGHPLESLTERLAQSDQPHKIQWAYMAFEDGTLINYPGVSYFPEAYDARKRPWYTTGIQHSSPKFSMPYPDASGTGFLLPCNERITGPDNQPIGVVGVDVSMDTVIDIMQKLNLNVPHESYILNENGEVMFQTSERGQKIDSNLALIGNKIKEVYVYEHQALVEQIKAESPNGIVENHKQIDVYARFVFAPWTLVVSMDQEMLSCDNCFEAAIKE
ncbi:MAG: serine/threonine protein kinase [Myxococcota bacterium]|nr:serine/threonine protein kinase [Myxococcota bacterium]